MMIVGTDALLTAAERLYERGELTKEQIDTMRRNNANVRPEWRQTRVVA